MSLEQTDAHKAKSAQLAPQQFPRTIESTLTATTLTEAEATPDSVNATATASATEATSHHLASPTVDQLNTQISVDEDDSNTDSGNDRKEVVNTRTNSADDMEVPTHVQTATTNARLLFNETFNEGDINTAPSLPPWLFAVTDLTPNVGFDSTEPLTIPTAFRSEDEKNDDDVNLESNQPEKKEAGDQESASMVQSTALLRSGCSEPMQKKEMFLSDMEFSNLFGISKSEFETLTSWKQRSD
jgi:hypothetical protein